MIFRELATLISYNLILMDKRNEFIKVIKSNEGIKYKMTMIYSDTNEEQKDLY